MLCVLFVCNMLNITIITIQNEKKSNIYYFFYSRHNVLQQENLIQAILDRSVWGRRSACDSQTHLAPLLRRQEMLSDNFSI